jgi:hypothetical protein
MKDQKMMMNISLRTDWSFFLGFFGRFRFIFSFLFVSPPPYPVVTGDGYNSFVWGRCHTSKLFLQFWSIFGGENAVRREEESGIVIGEGRP